MNTIIQLQSIKDKYDIYHTRKYTYDICQISDIFDEELFILEETVIELMNKAYEEGYKKGLEKYNSDGIENE